MGSPVTELVTELSPTNTVQIKGEMLSDLMTSLDASGPAPDRMVQVRCTVKRITEMRHSPAEQIRIEDLAAFGFDAEFSAHLKTRNITLRHGYTYVSLVHWLLKEAHFRGWTCEIFELRDIWEPAYAAFRGVHRAGGASGIIEFAIRHRLRPWEFTASHRDAWAEEMDSLGRSPGTIEQTENKFRFHLRKAGLQDFLPLFNLESRRPSDCGMSLSEMTPPLRGQILTILHWKTAEVVPGRPARFRIRPVSAHRLLADLRVFCGFASRYLPRINSLAEILTDAIVTDFIDWSLQVRGRTPGGIHNSLAFIYAVTQQYHELFTASDYRWFGDRLKRIPRESKSTRRKTKLGKVASFKRFAEISGKIRELREQSGDLTPAQEARLYHDELYFSLICDRPWRQRNHRECSINPSFHVNIFEETITDDIRRKLKQLPPEVQEYLDNNPDRPFLLCRFREFETKNGKEVWELFPLHLAELYREYVKRRHLLLPGGVDKHGCLFVNKAGGKLSSDQVIDLVARYSRKYVDKRLTPHMVRSMAALFQLEAGGTLADVQVALWHSTRTMSWEYAGGPNASLGIVALAKFRAERNLTAA